VDLASRLARHGYDASPHLAARLVRDSAHLDGIVAQLAEARVASVFVVGGDGPSAVGPYPDALSLLRALDSRGHHFLRIGIAGYPEGHGHIEDALIEHALREKAPYATYLVTQLCFRSATTTTWARRILTDGVQLPVRVGLPGAVSRQKLVRIAGGLGLGQSARFLQKQSSLLWRFLLPGGFSPDRLVDQFAGRLGRPDARVQGLHVFTFNELAATEAWRQALLARLS
jgi:methylenetetrahydrofolate reductase (NADPH)